MIHVRISILVIIYFAIFIPLACKDTLPYKPAGFDQARMVQGKYGDNLNYKLYLPSQASGEMPLVFFVNGVGSDVTTWNSYIDWPKACAAHGLTALVYEAKRDSAEQNSKQILNQALSGNLSNEIDTERIVLWMCSANGMIGTKILMDSNYYQIKGGSMYYPVLSNELPIRTNVKVELVRAGKDSYHLNKKIDDWIVMALSHDLDIRIINFPGGRHAFDIYDEELSQTVPIIKETIDFLLELAHGKTHVSNPMVTPFRIMDWLEAGKTEMAQSVYRSYIETQENTEPIYFIMGCLIRTALGICHMNYRKRVSIERR